MALKFQYARLLCTVAFVTAAVSVMARTGADLLFGAFKANASSTSRMLYAVNQSSTTRGSVSVYDIDQGHRLVKTIPTASNVDNVRGVAVNASTGKLYVAYRTRSGVGMIYCLDVHGDAMSWNRAIDPDVDRLSIHPNGRLLYVPTGEGGSADYINVLDAESGDVVRKVRFSNRSHDTMFPLSGPLF
jgi:DNA-binding beta-propeller fold protein YncE